MKIARVFPRKTKATPTDDLAYWGGPDLFTVDVDEVHVSVTFDSDLGNAERLAKQWEGVAPVKIGGPGTGAPGGNFEPGKYLKPGYVITSRGCNNRCGHCRVPEREGRVREIPITEGWNVLDDNILQCSESHIRNVFAMLKRQNRRAKFTGGLEAAALRNWHVDLLVDLKPEEMFFAYDDAADYEPLVYAIRLLRRAGFTRHHLRCYVLCGEEGDTLKEAEKRMYQVVDLGIFPMAMVYMNDKGEIREGWREIQKQWTRPGDIYGLLKSQNINQKGADHGC